jgi:allantoate deiminase
MAPPVLRLWRMLEELGRVSDERGRLTRTFLSPAMRRANGLVGSWMKAAGLVVHEDAVGNLIGRRSCGRRGAGTLVLGSHLDTVRDAGRFDGALGVLLPIVALAELRRRKVSLPFDVEVVGFSEEEGVRFSSAYLGSKGYTGQLRAADLRLRDAEGISVRKAILAGGARSSESASRRLSGGLARLRQAYGAAGRSPALRDLIGYVEVHIEQGPVLAAKGLPVGVVSAIAGQTRGRMTFRGKAGHAGTTPMKLRRDALAGAAEFVLKAEAVARRAAALVATVGTIAVEPGASNVIPGEATLSLDLRHPRDPARRAALRRLLAAGRTIARRRKLQWSWKITQDNGAVACSPALTASLGESVKAVASRTPALVSGAGHDAVVMSAITPVAMLFVRCRDGLSHHPAEYAAPADLGVALKVVEDFLRRLAERET